MGSTKTEVELIFYMFVYPLMGVRFCSRVNLEVQIFVLKFTNANNNLPVVRLFFFPVRMDHEIL
jgi:hypothetical protein